MRIFYNYISYSHIAKLQQFLGARADKQIRQETAHARFIVRIQIFLVTIAPTLNFFYQVLRALRSPLQPSVGRISFNLCLLAMSITTILFPRQFIALSNLVAAFIRSTELQPIGNSTNIASQSVKHSKEYK
jgi:hypothetical protein